MGLILLLLAALEGFAWFALTYNPGAINMVIGVGLPLVLLGVPWLLWKINEAIDSWYWNRLDRYHRGRHWRYDGNRWHYDRGPRA